MTKVAPLTLDSRFQLLLLRVLAWLVVAAIGAVHAWASRREMPSIVYLDLANAYLRGDWSLAINRLWSPLYPALLALALWVQRSTPSHEFATAHLLNFVIFLGALASFEFFLSQLIGYHRTFAAEASSEGRVVLPEWCLRLMGYGLFAYSSLELTPMSEITPDLFVAVFVYLASGFLLKIRLRPDGAVSFLLLGVVLGLGYLAKAPLFPLAFVFLALAGATVYSHSSLFDVLRRVLVALIPFALITGSLVMAFYLTGQGVTLGESGKLNYAWHVNGLPYEHWQGEFPGSGKPVHPTRKIFPSPPLYEFATPVGGTYPPWDNPAYWYEGVKLRFDMRGHLHTLIRSAGVLLSSILRSQVSLVINGLLLVYLGRRGRLFLRDMLPYSILLIPSLAAIGMFSLIWLRMRFVGPFVPLFWLGLYAPMTFAESSEAKRVLNGIAVAMLAMLLLSISYTSYETVRVLLARQPPPELTVAQGLQQLGMHPGDRVGVIRGFPDPLAVTPEDVWALLSSVRIIAEIPACRAYAGSLCKGEPAGVSSFLRADQETKDRILKIFAKTGAKAVVMRNKEHTSLLGWRWIPDTDYYVYLLKM